jgi:two-component system, NarL family, invasion response regulator UvrY
MIRILIADDHAIVRKGLIQLIMEEYKDAEIGEASNAEDVVKKTILNEWDVVICDLNMPGRSGLDALKQIKQAIPKLPVLIMSMYSEQDYGYRVIKAGAAGFLAKDSIHDDLIKAIQTVLRGKNFITPVIGEKLAEALYSGKERLTHESLSDREFEVFRLLASGKMISEIADKLSLSATTVSTYRARILQKMQMRSNTDLAKYALENGLI